MSDNIFKASPHNPAFALQQALSHQAINKNVQQYLRRNPGKPSARKVNLSRVGSFVFDKSPDDNRDDKVNQDLSSLCAQTIVTSYLRSYYTVVTDSNNLWESLKGQVTFDIRECLSIFRSLILEYGHDANFRIEGPDYIEEIFIREDLGGNTGHYQLWNVQYYKKKTVARVSLQIISKDFDSWNDISHGSWYTSKRQKDAEAALRNNSAYGVSFQSGIGTTDYRMLLVMNNIMRIFIDRRGELQESVIRDHHYVEMYFIKKFMKLLDSPAFRVTSIFGLIDSTHRTNPEFGDIILGYDHVNVVKMPNTSSPMVDFSDKEKAYVAKYIYDHNYIGRDGVGINLVEYMSHPRYGSDLRMKISNNINENIITKIALLNIGDTPDDVSKGEFEFYTSFTMEPDHKFLRFYAVYMITPDKAAYSVIDFINIHKFNIYENILSVTTALAQYDDELYTTVAEVDENVPDIMRSIDGVLTIFCETLAVHIMLHDRPRRTRIVRYQERVEPREKGPRIVNDPEPEFVVRRILKPVEEAKQLVAESGKHRELGDRIYTMEEWERVGHLRRLPGSEATVWIPATTCHRKKKLLNDKEVHLKL